MAGDWLKFDKTTPDKPEVFIMAGILGIDPDAVVGKLLRVWSWFDSHTDNGNAPVTVAALLDRLAGVTGFIDATVEAGWVKSDGVTLTVPNFGRHNGQTAKTRALGKNRSAIQRAESNAKSNDDSVTPPLQKRYQRREEKSNTPLPPEGGLSPFLESVWKAGPIATRHRSSKKQLASAWARTANKPPEAEVLRVLELWVKSHDWTKQSGEFAPGIHRWVQCRQWENDPTAEMASTPRTKDW